MAVGIKPGLSPLSSFAKSVTRRAMTVRPESNAHLEQVDKSATARSLSSVFLSRRTRKSFCHAQPFAQHLIPPIWRIYRT
jgi:hypothetical protein